MLSILSCAFRPSVCLQKIFCLFLIGFVVFTQSCMNSLYILEINLLLVASFGNMFSHPVGCLFIQFIVSFAVQKSTTFYFILFFQLHFKQISFLYFIGHRLFTGNTIYNSDLYYFPVIGMNHILLLIYSQQFILYHNFSLSQCLLQCYLILSSLRIIFFFWACFSLFCSNSLVIVSWFVAIILSFYLLFPAGFRGLGGC